MTIISAVSPSRTKALVELLTSLFSADELRRFAAFLPGTNVVAALPSGTASLETLAFEMVQALERRGQIGKGFFARLEEERPGRKVEITWMRAQYLDSKAPALDPLTNEHSSKHASLAAKWSPRHVHTLQRARHFVARQEVLARLRTWYATASPQDALLCSPRVRPQTARSPRRRLQRWIRSRASTMSSSAFHPPAAPVVAEQPPPWRP